MTAERFPGQRAYRLVTGSCAVLYGAATLLVFVPLCLTPLLPLAAVYAFSGAMATGLLTYAWATAGGEI